MVDEFDNSGRKIYEVSVTRTTTCELHTTVRVAADDPDEAESTALAIVADFDDGDFDYCPDYPDSDDAVTLVEEAEPTEDEMDEEDRENAANDSYCALVNAEAERNRSALSDRFGRK